MNRLDQLEALKREAEQRRKAAEQAAKEQYRLDVEAIERVRALMRQGSAGVGSDETGSPARSEAQETTRSPRPGTLTQKVLEVARSLEEPFTAKQVFEHLQVVDPAAASQTTDKSVSATLSRRVGSDYKKVRKGRGGKSSLYRVLNEEGISG